MSELTPEERHRIYEEERSRIESAKSSPPDNTYHRTSRKGSFIPLLLLTALLAGGLSMLHICWNIPSVGFNVFIKEQPSFTDTFFNFHTIEDTPKIVAIAQHASIIHILEREGLIKWHNDIEDRLKEERRQTQSREQEESIEKSNVTVSGKVERDVGDRFLITGTVKNQSKLPVRYWKALVYFLDKQGNILDTNYTNQFGDLPPGAQKYFTFTCPEVPKTVTYRFEMTEVDFEHAN